MRKVAKCRTRKLIIILVIVMLCNFIMPRFAYANEINGGIFFKPVAQFITKISDLVIQCFQYIFIGDPQISTKSSFAANMDRAEFYIKFSPGIIFSGKIPGLDVNFISPMEPVTVRELRIIDLGVKGSYADMVENAVPQIIEMAGYTYATVDNDTQKKIEEMSKYFRECNYADWYTSDLIDIEIDGEAYYYGILGKSRY